MALYMGSDIQRKIQIERIRKIRQQEEEGRKRISNINIRLR